MSFCSLVVGKSLVSLLSRVASSWWVVNWIPHAVIHRSKVKSRVFRPTAVIQSYNMTASGGSEKARYSISGGYFQQDGTIVGSQFERFTLRANGDLQVNKILKIGNSISLTHLEDRQITSNSGEYGTVQTRLPGFRFCEYLPLLASRASKFSIVKTMHHVADRAFRNEHSSCSYLLHTGSTALPVGGASS